MAQLSNLKKPLDGVRILDLSRLFPGPLCTHYLTELGAEVIKIEDPNGGDYARATFVSEDKTESGSEPMSNFFKHANRGKKSVTLNLGTKLDQSKLHKLALTADVVVESFRPGVADRLGAGYTELSGINPRLVYVSITGYGQTGESRNKAGHDLNYLASSGLLDQLRDGSGVPIIPRFQLADVFGGAIHGVTAVLAGIVRRERFGLGSYTDISMTECCMPLSTAPLTMEGASTSPIDGTFACYQIYPTKDGQYIAMGAAEPKFWANFCNAVERPDWIETQYSLGSIARKLKAEVGDLFKTKTQSEWCQILDAVDCCFTPVVTAENVLKKTTQMPLSMPLKISGLTFNVSSKAPKLGEHNSEFIS